VDTTIDYDFFALDEELASQTEVKVELPRSQAFARLKVYTICLSQNRGGFGSSDSFGPGEGIGCGAVLGGVCEGGVCY
jgi:hypothetical protein